MKRNIAISAALAGMLLAGPAAAAAKSCMIEVVGGSWKGYTHKLAMENGEFVGTSGVKPSELKSCKAKKYIVGRWYHICSGGKIIVFKKKDGKWKRLSAKSLKKYQHNCL